MPVQDERHLSKDSTHELMPTLRLPSERGTKQVRNLLRKIISWERCAVMVQQHDGYARPTNRVFNPIDDVRRQVTMRVEKYRVHPRGGVDADEAQSRRLFDPNSTTT